MTKLATSNQKYWSTEKSSPKQFVAIENEGAENSFQSKLVAKPTCKSQMESLQINRAHN